jgi:hypothetical protein
MRDDGDVAQTDHARRQPSGLVTLCHELACRRSDWLAANGQVSVTGPANRFMSVMLMR